MNYIYAVHFYSLISLLISFGISKFAERLSVPQIEVIDLGSLVSFSTFFTGCVAAFVFAVVTIIISVYHTYQWLIQ